MIYGKYNHSLFKIGKAALCYEKIILAGFIKVIRFFI